MQSEGAGGPAQGSTGETALLGEATSLSRSLKTSMKTASAKEDRSWKSIVTTNGLWGNSLFSEGSQRGGMHGSLVSQLQRL